jgi:hypothetical protein
MHQSKTPTAISQWPTCGRSWVQGMILFANLTPRAAQGIIGKQVHSIARKSSHKVPRPRLLLLLLLAL